MKTASSIAALSIILSVAACTTTTKFSRVWKNPDYAGESLQDVLVLGISVEPAARVAYEDAMKNEFLTLGLNATSSYSLLPESGELSEERIRAAISDSNFDSVAVTSLFAVQKDTNYVPPRTYAVPNQYIYSGIYGGYMTSHRVVHKRGYYETTTRVQLWTNVYTTDEDEVLVWSGSSETIDPASQSDAIASATQYIAKRMANDGVIGR